MSKLGLFFLSFVAAIPAGFLAVRLALDFLNRADQMDKALVALSATTLIMSTVVMVLPIAILIFGPKTEKEPEEAAPSNADVSNAGVAVVAEPESEIIISPSDEFETSNSDAIAAADDEFVTEDGLDVFVDETLEDEKKSKA